MNQTLLKQINENLIEMIKKINPIILLQNPRKRNPRKRKD